MGLRTQMPDGARQAMEMGETGQVQDAIKKSGDGQMDRVPQMAKGSQGKTKHWAYQMKSGPWATSLGSQENTECFG